MSDQRQKCEVFELDNVGDYLAMCKVIVAEFDAEKASVPRCFAAILALNHIPDWLRYKLSSGERKTLGIPDTKEGSSVKDFFENEEPALKLVRDVANGFKHLRLNANTENVCGFGQGPYDVGPYGTSYLLIDDDGNYSSADKLCCDVLSYWTTRLQPVL